MASYKLPTQMALAALLLPCALSAQDVISTPEPPGWFPSRFAVRPFTGTHTGIDIGTGPIVARRDSPAGSGRHSPEADVAFGYRIPVYRFTDGSGGGPVVDLGLEGGILARFALGDGLGGLVNSDFRVAFPFGFGFGQWEARLSPVHVSSHIGDNFIDQTPSIDPGTSARNGVETDLMYRIGPAVRVGAGADYNWEAVGVETVGARFGASFDPPGSFRPIGSLGVHVSDYTSGPGITAMAGIGLRTRTGELRLGLVGHTGPSEMGQFRRFDEEYIGLYLSFVPEVVVRSGSDGH
ncbi:MAG: DUF1207 domain-containing protein [Gemmatimonadota bacterium]